MAVSGTAKLVPFLACSERCGSLASFLQMCFCLSTKRLADAEVHSDCGEGLTKRTVIREVNIYLKKKLSIDGICTDSSYMNVVNLNLLKCKMNFNDDLVNRLQPCNAEGMTQTCQTHTYISLEYH